MDDTQQERLTAVRGEGRALLVDLMPGDEFAGLRAQLAHEGMAQAPNGNTLFAVTRLVEGTDEYEVLELAAVNRSVKDLYRGMRRAEVLRDPGLSQDFLEAIQDFQSRTRNQAQTAEFCWNIFKNEGMVNSATTAFASIVAGGGSFKVRAAKRGKARKAKEQLEEILYQWTRDVNGAPMDAVVTSTRGLKQVTKQGVMYALIEGSWFGRTVWTDHHVVGQGDYSLPMVVETISTADLEPVQALVGSTREAYYWKPPRALLQQLRKPDNKDIKNLLNNFVSKDMLKVLMKEDKVLLDPALLMHVKHKGRTSDAFGDSFIMPALSAIAFRRAVEQLDLVTMQSLVNRMVIIQIGSDDPKSPYSKIDVATQRTKVMQAMTADPGPNMFIVWTGHDVKVQSVGAHDEIVDLGKSHAIADRKLQLALGVPDVFLSGTTSEGKAAGWAALLAAQARLDSLANQFCMIWQSLGERIAEENNFTDVDLVYEWDQSLMIDRTAEADTTRNDFAMGLLSRRTMLEARGRNFAAEREQLAAERGLEVGVATDEEIFRPPEGLPGGSMGQLGGRPTNQESGRSAPSLDPNEAQTPIENK
jgi:hypothetical protein